MPEPQRLCPQCLPFRPTGYGPRRDTGAKTADRPGELEVEILNLRGLFYVFFVAPSHGTSGVNCVSQFTYRPPRIGNKKLLKTAQCFMSLFITPKVC